MKKETNLNYGVQLLLQGKSLYFHEQVDSFCIFETALSLKRDIAEPDNEGIVRGPHTGFVEDLATNLASIRKLIKSPNIVVKYFTLGEEMHTKVAINKCFVRNEKEHCESALREVGSIYYWPLFTVNI